MSPGQMLPEQMSLWQLESVLDVPRNLPLKFHQNRVRYSWDIADLKVPCGGGGGWWWWWCKPIFVSNPQPSCFGLLLGWVAVAWLGFGVMTIIRSDQKSNSVVPWPQLKFVGLGWAASWGQANWKNWNDIRIPIPEQNDTIGVILSWNTSLEHFQI